MNKLERHLAEELQRRAGDVPPAMGNLERVRRVGRHRLMASRLASLVVLTAVAVAASVALTGRPATGTPVAGEPLAIEDMVPLTPFETNTLMVRCLQERGLAVVQEGEGISFDNRVVSQTAFERTYDVCERELRSAGYLLPGDNPEYARVGYVQYLALADCYRAAGIVVSDPPSLSAWVAARLAGIPTWSPTQDAIRIAGLEAAQAAENRCVLPTAEEVWAED